MTRTEDRETVIAEARKYARSRVIPMFADDTTYEPTSYEANWMSQLASAFVAGADALLALVDAREQQDEEHDQTASR
jgi:hypothetical protein